MRCAWLAPMRAENPDEQKPLTEQIATWDYRL